MKDVVSDIQRDNDTVYVQFCKDISKLNKRWCERDVLHGNHHLMPLIYSANHFSLGDANLAFFASVANCWAFPLEELSSNTEAEKAMWMRLNPS